MLSVFLLLLSQCRPKPDDAPDPEPEPANGAEKKKLVYVLNEGLFHSNNSTLTLHLPDSDKTYQDVFASVNKRNLGDTGNDIAVYGSRLYIVVTGSGKVEVTDCRSLQSLAQIDLSNNGKNREPRKIVFHKGLGFVTCFDGTVAVLDTASLSVIKFIKVGRNPESLVVSGNKLYVTNSGGLDSPDYDHTVSVIDLLTYEEIRKIEVGINPGGIAADRFGDVYVISRGNYNDIPSELKLINPTGDKVVKVFDFSASGIEIIGDSALVTHHNNVTGKTELKLLDLLSEQIISDNFIDLSGFETFYSIKQDVVSGDLYLSDAKQYVKKGKVVVYDRKGIRKYEFEAGLNPGDIEIVNTNIK
jgi:YVTN family beta-propeller protein